MSDYKDSPFYKWGMSIEDRIATLEAQRNGALVVAILALALAVVGLFT
jgi:type IV secretory pathway component VirB8